MIVRLILHVFVLIGLFLANGWLNLNKELDWVSLLFFKFTVAGSEWVPANILLGILVAGNVIFIAKNLSNQLKQKLSQRAGVRASNVEALTTLFGYVAYVVATLFGISLAGIDLTNFAIIAGALSVGIGFGLQNIVNNFVSGIILLIEQPVRTGDFVQVAGLEGTVRRVSIRSTEILTFDHSSVIVPNSQLISDSLTNWNLRDNFCRVNVFVGVAYGSDTRKVEQLLIEAALQHELVIPETKGPILAPFVQFTDFGDSSLNFKLVAYIRDAGKRFSVASQIRYKVDDAFREHGITIPFPQRDVHMIAAANENLEPTSPAENPS